MQKFEVHSFSQFFRLSIDILSFIGGLEIDLTRCFLEGYLQD